MPGKWATIALIFGQKYDSTQTPSQSVTPGRSHIILASLRGVPY